MKRFQVHAQVEQFHPLADIPVFSEKAPAAEPPVGACCASPGPQGGPVGIVVKPASCCC